jgi:flavin-dependent dehydrogenase
VPLPSGALVVTSRESFDSALLTAAIDRGATFIPARVSGIEKSARGFTTVLTSGETVHSRQIIGADGANSFTRRSLGKPFGRHQLSIATGFFARGVTSDEIVIELRNRPAGYLWSFPRTDHLAIGICAQADGGVTAGMLKSMAAGWITHAALAAGASLEPYAWPIPSLTSKDFDSLEPAGDGWFLVGDAAGLVDPITREGIYFALQSAQFAAEAVLGDAARARRTYVERIRSEIGTELSRAARLKAAFFSSRFTPLFMAALARSEAIRLVMADLVTGTQSYGTLTWRLAATLEFGLAWKLLTRPRAPTT